MVGESHSKFLLKPKKWSYLFIGAKKRKNKGTLFSQTLKVEENKVGSELSFFAYLVRYCHLFT